MKLQSKICGFLIVWFLFLSIGCYKNSTVIQETSEVTRTVYFSTDIIPILNGSCNMSGCHSSGGKTPDLSQANAYLSLTNGGYINTEDPESSSVYLWMTGQKGTPMPPSGTNSNYNALMLAWIEQGALNN